MSKIPTDTPTDTFLLIHYRTRIPSTASSLESLECHQSYKFYQYYLEETDPNEPLVQVMRRAISSLEGDQWRLVTWDGDIHNEVSPLSSWQPTVHYKGVI